MSELGRKTVKATLKRALVMCLSLWAYYIQIKGEFTDRRQAPAPISNQTVPSGEPCGAHICGHSLTAWHPSVLQESSTRIMGSCEWECSTLSEHWEIYLQIRYCIYEHWQNVSWFILCSLCSRRTSRQTRGGWGSRWRALMCFRLPFWSPTLFKAPLRSAQKPFWKSICNTASFVPTPFIQQHNVGAVSVSVCIVMNMCLCVCVCARARLNAFCGPNVRTACWRMRNIFSVKRRRKLYNVHPPLD